MMRISKLVSLIVIIAVCNAFAASPAFAFTNSAHLVSASSQYFTSASTGFTTAWTMEAWIKPTSNTTFQAVMGQPPDNGTGGNNLAYMFIADGHSTKIDCQANNSAGSGVEVPSTTVIPTDTWTHVACTWDGSTITVFINGVSDNTGSFSGTRNAGTNLFQIGDYLSGGGTHQGYFNGQLFMARTWGTNLSASTILANYCTTLGATTNLKAEWTLDNSTSDTSGNSKTLTGVNSPTFTADVPSQCTAVAALPDFGSYFMFGDW